MKLGISLKIDVTKIDKTRLFQGKNGAKYLDITTFVDLDTPSQYGDHGFITQNVSKEERDNGVKGEILGNTKVFYNDNQQANTGGYQQTPQPQGGFMPQHVKNASQSQGGFQPQQPQNTPEPTMDFDDDIPF